MRNKPVILASVLAVSALLYFPVRFAVTFEIFGNAVHSRDKGWLGPTPRGSGACVVDVGKVNSWTCPDTAVFDDHRYGCQLWLRSFGYLQAASVST